MKGKMTTGAKVAIGLGVAAVAAYIGYRIYLSRQTSAGTVTTTQPGFAAPQPTTVTAQLQNTGVKPASPIEIPIQATSPTMVQPTGWWEQLQQKVVSQTAYSQY